MSAYYNFPNPGCIRIGGADRRAFLQRQTTNHIDLLTPQRALLTVLTSSTARILDVLLLLEDGDEIIALTLPGQAAATFRYLRSRVFFMDKVTLTDESAAYAQTELFAPGPASPAALGFSGEIEPNTVETGQNGLRCIGQEPSFGPACRLFAPAERLNDIEDCLRQAGAGALSADEYALRRIEAGLPSHAEWNEDYTPLETGLRAAISDSKGCYTGQEIIARQITYDKVTRRLCGLRLDQPISAPADLYTPDGAPSGRLTSTAVSPRLGPIALGIVKRPFDAPGTVLQAGATDQTVRAEVFELSSQD